MADWYVSSVAYAAIPAFVASTAYTVGQIIRPSAAGVGVQYPQRCTTAGTAATEPTWATADNATTTTGGATFTNVGGQSAYGWGAACGTLYSLGFQGSKGASPGDRIFVSSDSSETNASYQLGFTGAQYGLMRILSVNRAGNVPPQASDIQNGAALSMTGATALLIDPFCNLFFQGFTLTQSGTGNLMFGSSGLKSLTCKNCAFVVNGGSVTSNNPPKVIWDNCTLQFNTATGAIVGAFGFDLIWINSPSAIQGSTIPTRLFAGQNWLTATLRGVDLSALTTTILIPSASLYAPAKVLLDGCKIAPGVTRYSAPAAANNTFDEIELVNCYDGANVLLERHTPAGDLVVDRSVTLVSGAADDYGLFALKLASSSRSDFLVMPLDSFWLDVESALTGPRTATVEVISAASLNNTDITLLLEYLGTVGSPVVSLVSSLASALTASSALPTSSNAWNVSSPPMTWNSADNVNMAVSGGNLVVTPTAQGSIRSLGSVSGSGKYYFEIAVPGGGSNAMGLATPATNLSTSITTAALVVAVNNAGGTNINGTGYANIGSSASFYCIAFDVGAQLVWLRNGASGQWNGSGTANPATGVGGLSFSSLGPTSTPIYAWCGAVSGSTPAMTANFGATAFGGAIPSGFASGFGVPVGGSFPTSWNPTDLSNITLSNSNLTATSTNNGGVRGILGNSAGKFYWEYKINTNGGGSAFAVGIALSSPTFFNLSTGTSTGAALVGNSGTGGGGISVNNGAASPSLGALGTNTISVAVDLTANLIWFRIAPSGNWNASGTANPATGTGGISISSIATGPLFPVFATPSSGDSVTANFGASSFSGAVPSGFASGFSATPVKQLLQASFSPQGSGRVRGLVRLGKVSSTVWVNPQIAIG